MTMTVTTAKLTDAKDYVGLKFYDAISKIHCDGLRPRVVRDGSAIYTIDPGFCGDRVNLELDGGVVTNAQIG
jgi:hypothetical protein